MAAPSSRPGKALALLLAINLFNYIDRQVLAAVEPEIRHTFFAGNDSAGMTHTGWLATAFLVSYMVLAPVLGWAADRMSRWLLIGASVAIWSLASGGSGLAATFGMLLGTRVLVGIGEAGYGPAAPTIISDLYPVEKRGQKLALFYLAIPVGSALGYVLGGAVDAHLGWRWAFYLVVPPGLVLAFLCVLMRDPRPPRIAKPKAFDPKEILQLFKIPSYVLNTAAMTALTFAIGGIAFWIRAYLSETRKAEFPDAKNLASQVTSTFGAITVVAGLLSTIIGGWAGDKLRPKFPSAYFLVSGIGMLVAFPAMIAMIYVPFPLAWVFLFISIFFLFFNTGPSNTALANVTPPEVRATAFAVNIFIIHLLGDAASPPLIGWIAGRSNMNRAFLFVSGIILLASVFWFWGMRYLPQDTAAVENAAGATLEKTPDAAE